MRKITLMAALLGSFYFTNAQVGIGTPTPSNSSQLDIVATNKGVLIPRVALTELESFSPITGTAVESLLVYNTVTAGSGNTAVSPGFYYWVKENGSVNAHWERIVNQAQLDQAISNITDLQGDVDKIISLLKVAFPANNLVDPTVSGDTHGGGMVFTPGTTPTIEYVYFDGTNYVKKDITNDIVNIIKGAESKTLLVKTTDDKKQYYLSETFIVANTVNGVYTAPTQAIINGWTTATIPTGVYQVDVVGGVVNNIQEIINSTINITEGGQTFTTVEEYIQYIASQADGNVVYKNIGTSASPNWVLQYWDGTQYQTINLTDLVGAAQSKTLLVKTDIVNAPVKQYYLSETFIVANTTNGIYTSPTQAIINGWTTATIPAGVYEIDIVAGVSTNFETILDQTTTIVKSTTPTTYYTVKEYIEYISQNNLTDGVTRIELDGSGQASFQQWNNTTNTWVNVGNAAFSTIVKANETKTTIGKSIDNSAYTQVTVNPVAVDKIVYEYLAENATNYMDLTSDVEWSIENNTDVQNAIEEIVNNLLSQGGNVYFTRTDIAAGTPTGQLAIPAFSFYTIDATGVKELVNIAQTIVNAITNADLTQITAIKNALGDKIVNNSSVITGDTFNTKAVRKGSFTTTINANEATTTGITLDVAAGEIISITVKYGSGLIANVTDLTVSGTAVNFNIGAGNMYQVLGSADITATVIVEFAVQ